jgi:pimeloyl-ACP methyl ester carboxylesterase
MSEIRVNGVSLCQEEHGAGEPIWRAGSLALSETVTRWLADLDEQVFAAAAADMSTVGETMLSGVVGDAGWEGLPEQVKQIFTANGPAIVAELRGGLLDVSAEELGTIVHPTLLVAGRDSPPAFARGDEPHGRSDAGSKGRVGRGRSRHQPRASRCAQLRRRGARPEPTEDSHEGGAIYRVILLPGAVLPAELAYGALIETLGHDVEAAAKDLEVYAGDEPPVDYSLDTEVAGVMRKADVLGWERFHLVGYSGGGASALAVAARRPDRLLSLALLEPAWAGGWDLSERERAIWREFEKLDALAPDGLMAAFVRLGLRSGIAPPASPPGPPPAWMRKRPAGIRAFTRTFRTYDLDRESLRRFDRPVYYALGGLSNPDQYGEIAERLSRVFDDFTLEVFEKRHHFDPPHRIEPERVARSLRTLWDRAEAAPPALADTTF